VTWQHRREFVVQRLRASASRGRGHFSCGSAELSSRVCAAPLSNRLKEGKKEIDRLLGVSKLVDSRPGDSGSIILRAKSERKPVLHASTDWSGNGREQARVRERVTREKEHGGFMDSNRDHPISWRVTDANSGINGCLDAGDRPSNWLTDCADFASETDDANA
jgi:hypothetical protein